MLDLAGGVGNGHRILSPAFDVKADRFTDLGLDLDHGGASRDTADTDAADAVAISEAVTLREPDAGSLSVRFDEWDVKADPWQKALEHRWTKEAATENPNH